MIISSAGKDAKGRKIVDVKMGSTDIQRALDKKGKTYRDRELFLLDFKYKEGAESFIHLTDIVEEGEIETYAFTYKLTEDFRHYIFTFISDEETCEIKQLKSQGLPKKGKAFRDYFVHIIKDLSTLAIRDEDDIQDETVDMAELMRSINKLNGSPVKGFR